MQLKQGLESVNGHWLLQFRWQFIPQYTTFILDGSTIDQGYLLKTNGAQPSDVLHSYVSMNLK